MPAKPWWQSRIIWLNVLSAVLAVAEGYAQIARPIVGDVGYLVAVLLLTAANAALRVDTTQPIAKGEP